MLRRFTTPFAASLTFPACGATAAAAALMRESAAFKAAPASSTSSRDDAFEYVSPRDIIEPKNSYVGKLMAPRTPHDKSASEVSWRTMRAQPHFFEIPVRQRHVHGWQRAREDWYQVETKLIWAAFEAPERIPLLLRDEVIRGHRAVFEDPKWLDRALYWVKEARYWRTIGIAKPFYDRDTLRAYAWAQRGQAFGQPVISSAMRDAISDLERARKRKDAGLDPNYVWDRWGPSGFVDGKRSDYLPRFAGNPYIDPDGIQVEDDELSQIKSHEQIRERYGEFIWGDETPFAHCFTVLLGADSGKAAASAADGSLVDGAASARREVTNGGLELHDFSQDVSDFYYTLQLGAPPPAAGAGQAEIEARHAAEQRLTQSGDDIRCLVYCSTQLEELQPKFDEYCSSQGAPRTWASFKAFLAPIRAACDEKVDACRLLHWSSREIEQAREFFAEKCGFVDFMMTSDKVLTAASMCQLRALKQLASPAATEWGLPLCLALTDKEKADAIGVDAYAVWRELEDLCIDRRRRIFTQRFTEPASEERTLDGLLAQFARRPQRTDTDPAALGAEYDREVEPIGRTVQRRVLSADVVHQAGVIKRTGPAGEKQKRQFEQRRTSKTINPYDSLRQNQFAANTRSF